MLLTVDTRKHKVTIVNQDEVTFVFVDNWLMQGVQGASYVTKQNSDKQGMSVVFQMNVDIKKFEFIAMGRQLINEQL